MHLETGQNITQTNGLGTLWVIGWIFTIGYLRLSFWKGVLALIIWPYYLGKHFSKVDKV
jgi:hypothetical protein